MVSLGRPSETFIEAGHRVVVWSTDDGDVALVTQSAEKNKD